MLKWIGMVGLGIPLIVGVVWAGDGRLGSWGSALSGFVTLLLVVALSSSFGIWSSGD